MKIIGFDMDHRPDPLPAVRVECWYDKSARVWILTYKDAEGNQVGDAEYEYNRKSAAVHVDQMRAALGIKD